DGPVFGEAEQARARTARLRPRRDRADRDETESLAEQRVGHFAVLVEAGRHADGVGEDEPGDSRLERAAAGRRPARQDAQTLDRQAMRTLGIERKQRGAGEAVEHGLPMAARARPVDGLAVTQAYSPYH